MTGSANHIIHEVIVLDASSSMRSHAHEVVKVTDALISQLAGQVSMFPDQETRITVYAFSSENFLGGQAYQCLIWDKDVLRVPSISGLYRPYGNTALCATMMQVIDDMKAIPVRYGEHVFLVYLVTDGQENWSRVPHNIGLERWKNEVLSSHIAALPDTWTIAALVPGLSAKQQLARMGFSPGNVEVWDPSKQGAVEEVGRRISETTVAYAGAVVANSMRGTRNLFSMAAPSKNDITATMTPLTEGSYYFEEVTPDDLTQIDNGRIDQFMQLKTGRPYLPGSPVTFYQMFKRERIQGYKRLAVAVPDHATKKVQVYTGANARAKLGLPDHEVRVSPGRWKDYRVFVETTSMNRKLYPGTSVLVMR